MTFARLALLLAVGACGGNKEAASSAPVAAEDAAVAHLRVHQAVRCGECHGKMEREWTGSAHANAARSPLFLALQQDSGGGADCDRCHAPLRALAPREPAVGEGVTCDVCHTIRESVPSRRGAAFALQLGDMVRYGPICDAADHYFHRMGCSELHATAALCGACHLWYRSLPGGGELPIFTEYEEWLAGPFAADGVQCQSCHMPGTRAEVAQGSAERAGVSDHGFLGTGGELRRQALTLAVTIVARAPRLRVEVVVKNERAGHKVPSGLPERRVSLRVRALDGAGGEIQARERFYGRSLVDDAGAEVPFYRATRVGSDDRLGPGEARRETFELDAAGATELRVDLRWLPISPELAAAAGAEAPSPELLVEKTIPLAAPR